MKIQIGLLLSFILIFLTNRPANAAVITCQKPNDIVLVFDNSQSIGESTTGDPNNPSAEDSKEWPSLMDFGESFVKSFTVSPQFTNVALVTFDGASREDINSHNQLKPIGDLLYSDTIVNLSSSTAPLTDGLDKLRNNRRVPPIYRPWTEYPPYSVSMPPFQPIKRYPIPDKTNYGSGLKGFYGGATDVASGLQRSRNIINGSSRYGQSNLDKIVILITDGIPNDEINRLDPNPEVNASPPRPSTVYSNQMKADKFIIFTILVGFNSLCYSDFTPSQCANYKDTALAWIEALASPTTASDPRDYSFIVNDFQSFQAVVDSIINFTCGVEGLNVNGFVLVDGDITIKRAITTNNPLKFLDNMFFFNILRNYSTSRHFLSFD